MLNGPEPEVLTFNALLTILGRRSTQSIYDLMPRDPTFPRPRQIGSQFSVGWLRGEVMEWLNSRPRAEFNGLDAVERRRKARARGAQRGDRVIASLLRVPIRPVATLGPQRGQRCTCPIFGRLAGYVHAALHDLSNLGLRKILERNSTRRA